MPSAGLQIFGSGMRLQPVFPGSSDQGNGNITGFMGAQGFTTDPGQAPGQGKEIFGRGNTNNVASPATVVIVGTGNSASGNQGVVMGYNSTKGNQHCIAFGANAISGSLASGPGCVALGSSVNAGGTVGNGVSVAIGTSCIADRNGNVALGKSVTVTSPGVVGDESVGFGMGIQILNPITKGIAIGKVISIQGNNVLAVGNFDGLPPVSVNDSIEIGRPDQRLVRIGPYWFGTGTGKTVNVNDANAAPATDTGIILYRTINAGRVVTMPLAAGVPAGASIKILDVSGNASAVRTITAAPSGADTIVGAGVNPIVSAYGKMELISDGVSKWVKV